MFKNPICLLLILVNFPISSMEGDTSSKSDFYVVDVNDENTDISKLIIQIYYQKEDCSGYHEMIPYIKKTYEGLRDSQDNLLFIDALKTLNRSPLKRRFSISNENTVKANDFVHMVVKEALKEIEKSKEKGESKQLIAVNQSNNKVKIAIVGAVVTLGSGVIAAVVTLIIHFTS